jgi:DNA repair protein SbcD/Mre11
MVSHANVPGAGRAALSVEGAMRLLLFADLHLDAPFAWASQDVAQRRRLALRSSLVRICELAATERVDALCCAGDLYEQERFSPDTAQFLRDRFAQLHPLPVYLAPGNHDWLGPASLYRQVSWSGNVHVFASPRLEPVALADGLTLWGAAHGAPANTAGFLDGFKVDRSGVHLALFHGSEQAELAGELGAGGLAKVPHAPFRASQVAGSGLHHALVGHFHTPRDGDYHTYPGNPAPLAFGEQGERGAVLVEVGATGTVTRQRHRVSQADMHDITVAVDGAPHMHEVRARVEAALASLTGLVRVTLCGEVGPDVAIDLADLDGVGGHLDAVVTRVGSVTVAYDLDALAQERTVRGQFVRDVLAAGDLSDEQRRKVMVTGLRALDGRRHDLEVP